jgi:hypothetical protein
MNCCVHVELSALFSWGVLRIVRVDRRKSSEARYETIVHRSFVDAMRASACRKIFRETELQQEMHGSSTGFQHRHLHEGSSVRDFGNKLVT